MYFTVYFLSHGMYFITLVTSYLVRHAGFRLGISLFKATSGRLRIAIFEILASVGNGIPAKSANVNERTILMPGPWLTTCQRSTKQVPPNNTLQRARSLHPGIYVSEDVFGSNK